MKQERFTEQAQEALTLSQQLVQQYHHSQWDVEHILLALLQQERGLVGDILRELGVDAEAVKQEVVAVLEKSPKIAYETPQIYATPRIAQLLQAAGAEADRLKDEFIGIEHLLIAMRYIVPFRIFVAGIGLLMPGPKVSIAHWKSMAGT